MLDAGSRDDRAGRVVALVLDDLLAQARSREDGALGGDVVDLHQFRVAIRRTRSVVKAAVEVLPADRRRVAGERLRRLARATSPVRDLDVLIGDLPELVAEDGVPPVASDAILGVLQARRDAADAALYDEVRGAEGRETFAVWREVAEVHLVGGDIRPRGANRAAGGVVDDMVWAALGTARRRARRAIGEDDLEHWHDLRKALKALRYLLEAFGPMYQPDELEALVKPLRKLQNRIGVLQDLRVQAELLTDVAEELSSGAAAEARALSRTRAESIEHVHRRCRRSWEAFDTPETRAAARRLTNRR